MAKHVNDKLTIEMPLSTRAAPLTEEQIRAKLSQIIYGKDKKAARIAAQQLAKRVRYKPMG